MRNFLFIAIVLFCLPLFGQDKNPTIYNVVQQMPEYPAGEDSMWRFIHANIRYPDSAAHHRIQGRVVLGFVVKEDGSLSDITVKKGLCAELDSEGLRVVHLLPKFKPGIQDGKAVRVNFTLPLTFKMHEDTTNKIFYVVERMPQFPGGEDSLARFLHKNVTYPDDARENDVMGRVIVGFIVNEDGSITDIQVKKSVCPSLDAEAMRIAKLLPRFIPGSQRGKPVKVRFVLPIMFALASDGKREVRDYPKQKYIEGVYDNTQIPEMPEYPGGKAKMIEFLKKRVEYPSDALATGIEGTVVVSFVVHENGDLSDFAIAQDAYYSLNMEALRVAQMMPKFKPGMKDGKPVKARFRLPIIFKLDGSNTVSYTAVAKAIEYARSKVIYPQKAKDIGIQGQVIIGFVINKDGHLSDFKVVKSVHPLLDAEALRVSKLIPNFKPWTDDRLKSRKIQFSVDFEHALTIYPLDTFSLDKYPSYPGGDTAEVHLIRINIHYPEIPREKGIEGKVVVGFTVNEDGTLSDFNIVKSVDKDLDAEAMRVVKLIQKFNPPMRDGKPVKAKFGMPVVFRQDSE